jgi:hypothetical protein
MTILDLSRGARLQARLDLAQDEGSKTRKLSAKFRWRRSLQEGEVEYTGRKRVSLRKKVNLVWWLRNDGEQKVTDSDAA